MKPQLHLHYDKEADILECRFGEATESYYEDLGKEIFKRIDKKTGKMCGFIINSFKKRTEKKPLNIDIPLTPVVLQET